MKFFRLIITRIFLIFPPFFAKIFFRETNLFSREANCSLQGIAGGTFLYITFFEVSTCLSFSQNRMISTSSAIFYFQIKTILWINYKKLLCTISPDTSAWTEFSQQSSLESFVCWPRFRLNVLYCSHLSLHHKTLVSLVWLNFFRDLGVAMMLICSFQLWKAPSFGRGNS